MDCNELMLLEEKPLAPVEPPYDAVFLQIQFVIALIVYLNVTYWICCNRR